MEKSAPESVPMHAANPIFVLEIHFHSDLIVRVFLMHINIKNTYISCNIDIYIKINHFSIVLFFCTILRPQR